jgi:hypothetical protein
MWQADIISALRNILARVTPNAVKRQHEAWSTGRFQRRVNPLAQDYVERYGLEVRRGPFAGMRYDQAFIGGSGDAIAKLVGTYEQELEGVLAGWIEAGWGRIVNVGAAEGFYAVGLACALPMATVLAYDLDPMARARCTQLALLNGVTDRVRVLGECTPSDLESLPAAPTALLCDCEGCEATLLDPAAAPSLRSWEMLVELHEFIDPEIVEMIQDRFATSHEIALLAGESRVATVPPELSDLDTEDRLLLLGERRPGPMRWAHLLPRRR